MQIAEEWLCDLPQQFQGQKNIEVLIKAFARQLQEVYQVLQDINDLTDLDTAAGQNLDYVGTIIPLTRKEAGELAGSETTEPVMSDDRYRQFLRYQNLVNTNECTYYDLMEGLELLWDVSPIYYIEDPAMPATIILTMPFLKPGGEVVTLGEVPMIRPAGVRIEFEYLIKVSVITLVNWIYAITSAPKCGTIRCGTYPKRGTLGELLLLQTEVGIEQMQAIFEETKCGTIRVGGKLYNSTLGELITDDVEIEVSSDYEIQNLYLAGQLVSGTYPIKAVNGYVMGSSAETDATVTNVTTDLPLSGTLITGDTSGTVTTDTVVTVSEEVDVTPTVCITVVSAQKCGTSVCGE